MYWIAVIAAFLAMRYNEKKGHWPGMRAKLTKETEIESDGCSLEGGVQEQGKEQKAKECISEDVRIVES